MRGIVTLCGSTKFIEEFRRINAELTKAMWVVLSVGEFDRAKFHDASQPDQVALKAALDMLHKEKIAMSQAIVVINVGGYVGDSTRGEIQHAIDLGKKLYWLELQEAERPYLASMGRKEGDFRGNPSWERLLG